MARIDTLCATASAVADRYTNSSREICGAPGEESFCGTRPTNNDAVMVRIPRCIGGFQFGVLRTARRYRVHLGRIREAKECRDVCLALSIVPSTFFDIALLLFYCGRCIYPHSLWLLRRSSRSGMLWLRPKPKATGDAMFQFQVQPDSARGLYFHVRLLLCQSKTLSHFPIVSVYEYKNRKFRISKQSPIFPS